MMFSTNDGRADRVALLRTRHRHAIRKIGGLGDELIEKIALACQEPLSLGPRAKYDTEAVGQAERLVTEIRFALANNLCRCTGYDKIVRAVQAAAVRLAQPQEARP